MPNTFISDHQVRNKNKKIGTNLEYLVSMTNKQKCHSMAKMKITKLTFENMKQKKINGKKKINLIQIDPGRFFIVLQQQKQQQQQMTIKIRI